MLWSEGHGMMRSSLALQLSIGNNVSIVADAYDGPLSGEENHGCSYGQYEAAKSCLESESPRPMQCHGNGPQPCRRP